MTMEEVASEVNIGRAFDRVASNKGAPGPDRQSIEQVREHRGKILPALSRGLLDGSYRPGDIRRVWIPKAGGGQRGLGIPNVVDRIVQQAMHQVLSPHYEKDFHPSSHGFRPGRSCHTAIAEAQEHLAAGYEWVVDLDLEKFFDTVPHDRLLARLATKISDKRVLKLTRQMLQARVVMPDGLVSATTEGAPQGGPLSPLLSNIVLDELDHEIARRGHRFVRYADDMNIYVRSERAGQRVMASIETFIEKRLKLKVNKGKSAVAKPEGRHFLGFRLKRDAESGDVHVLLSARSKSRIDAKIRDLTPRNWGRSFQACIQALNGYLVGWIGYFGICSPVEEVRRPLQALDAHIRVRLRAIRLRQWKRRKAICDHLVWLGARRPTAAKAVFGGRKSWWALAHTTAVQTVAMPPRWFAKQGLESLAERWRRRHEPATPPDVAPRQLTLALG
ncbi:MAG: group II intron reverse transcriptase/maturase [Gammaproteobacteria bacterium]|nr:group II intron reverse transcriptase/maturase [Gammaproteobacteria bacterium]